MQLGLVVFFFTFSLLVLQVTLTRIFSVTLMYHFAFLVLSVTLFGLGAGGIFHYVHPFFRRRPSTSLVGLGLATAIAVPLCLWAVLRLPFSPYEFSLWNLALLIALVLIIIVPFFLCGLFLSLLYLTHQSLVSRLYAFDLMGAALGCGAAVLLLDRLGATAVPWLAAACFSLGSFLVPEGPLRLRALSPLLAGLLLLGGMADRLQIEFVKGRVEAEIEFEKWNAFSRVAVLDDGHRKIVQIDADAATEILEASWLERDGGRLLDEITGLVYRLRQDGEALVMGPGGGRDVAAARLTGNRVTAVEINPIIVRDLMLDRYHDFSGGLYTLPEVTVEVGDARSFLERSNEQFDVIQGNAVDTWASTSAGGFTLAESYLYTVEAFEAYFRRLRDDGILTLGRWVFDQPQQMLRIVSLALEAMDRLGIERPQDKIALLSDPTQRQGGGTPGVVFLRKTPFPREEVDLLKRSAEELGFRVLYTPGSRTDSAFSRLILSADRAVFYDGYPMQVRPTFDDRPFFFFTLKWGDVLTVWQTPSESRKNNAGLFILLILLLIMSVLTLLCLLLPVVARKGIRFNRRAGFYFLAVGLGFMMLEVVLIQKSILYLGHPTWAFVVVVCGLLIGSGMGSWRSRRVAEGEILPVLRKLLPLVGTAVGAKAVGLGIWLTAAFSWPLWARIVWLILPLIGLGLLLGHLFPLGLRSLSRDEVPWAWALNGSASVLGSILAVVVAMQGGFSLVLWIAAILYFLAALALLRGGSLKGAGYRPEFLP